MEDCFMFRWLGGLMDRSFAVIGAIVFAQAPLFMQQYSQQLFGRTAELKLQVDAMRHAASLSGKTLEQLTQKFMENPDADVALQGEVMFSMVSRWQHLSEGLAALQESSLWGRPFTFIYHLNSETFSSTLNQFKMGLPLNLEGGAYALLGIAIGYGIFTIFKSIFRKMTGLFRHSPQTQIS